MKRSLLLFLIVGATVAFAGSTTVSTPGPTPGPTPGSTTVPKIAPDIPGSPSAPTLAAPGSTVTTAPVTSSTPLDVIVRFKTAPTAVMLTQLGSSVQVKNSLNLIHAAHVSLSQGDVLALQNNPNVVYVSPNRALKAKLDVTTQTINANIAWNLGLDGTGVGVAVIDSGIALVKDLNNANQTASRVVYSQSFVSGQDATDGYGHGTHVAGIIGSNGFNSTGAAFSRTFKG